MMPCTICNNSEYNHIMEANGFHYYRCKKCSLEFIYPQPNDEYLTNLYSLNYYNAWDIRQHESEVFQIKQKAFLYKISLVREFLFPFAKILDCGCATGFFLDVAEESGYEAYGIEVSEYAANTCKQKHGDGKVFCGQMEDSYFTDNPDRKFQAIFMSDFIEHVRYPKQIIAQAYEMLDNTGVIVITTPKVKSFSYRISCKHWFQYKPEHLYYFSESNIKQLLTSCGFSNVRIEKAYKYISINYFISYFNTYKHFIFSPLSKILKFILPSFIKRKYFKTILGEMMVICEKTKVKR
jgi:2-polyprenyl-3-methyl-5-hydroxy-6-metoxy-1,4-benzoquinol methylase